MVVVAQLVEPQIVILVVAGSSPVDHPIFPIGSPILNREFSGRERKGEKETKFDMEPLENRIDYKFRNSLLLGEALTHPSLAYESQKPHFDNQRLEFLGDAVIQLIITEELYLRFPNSPEGQLTKLRSRLVSKAALAKLASKICLGDYILLGKGEQASGGSKRDSTLADTFEALIGAIYIDSGHAAAQSIVLRLVESEMEGLESSPEELNPKGQLQELLQALHPEAPEYEIISESGPDHRRVFQARVCWRGVQLATGKGKSKKDAEARAAGEALRAKSWQ